MFNSATRWAPMRAVDESSLLDERGKSESIEWVERIELLKSVEQRRFSSSSKPWVDTLIVLSRDWRKASMTDC